MNWFNDMKIGKKLIGAFIFVGAITAVVGYMGISSMGKIADMGASSYANETLGIVHLKQADIEIIHAGRAEKNLLLSSTPEERETYGKAIEGFTAKANEELEKAKPLIHTPEGKELLVKVDQAWAERQEVESQIVAAAAKDELEKKRDSVELSRGLGRQKADALEGFITQLVELKENNAKEAAEESDETYHSSRTLMLALASGGVLCGLILGFFIARSISKPLAHLAETAKHISLGDMSQSVDYRSGDEVGSLADSFRALVSYIHGVSVLLQKLAEGDLTEQAEQKSDLDVLTKSLNTLIVAMNEITQTAQNIAGGDLTVTVRERSANDKLMQALGSMVAGLNSTIRGVSENAASTSASSQQLAAASEAIASGAQEQAASLEETSSSLEEITATVRQSADNAKQASQLAVGSKDAALQGQAVLAEAITAMSEINAASAKIADIISTIDEIAFQTNLLAVNAAVEAARAGDEGRGFAVVASEVRSLAQRSAVAAKEVKVLIQDSLRKVEVGSVLVNRSGETLQGIVTSVKHVTDIVGEMAAAASEQSVGIEQVNTAITQLDQVTQSNSAQTEELSATAQSLSDQATSLLDLVSTFNLGDGNGNEATGRSESRRAEARFAPSDPGPRHPARAVRASTAAKVNTVVRIKKATIHSGAVGLAVPAPVKASDASFQEF
jgi:methyl-accepting chemotaxis protein